jgi:ribosomal protein S15P/S13E
MPKAKKTSEEKEEKKTKISHEEFEKKVMELAEKGLTAEKIGETLRKEGIHSGEHKKISKILKEKGKYLNPDITNIKVKLEKLSKHTEKNKQDKRAIRDRDRISAKLRRANNFFK